MKFSFEEAYQYGMENRKSEKELRLLKYATGGPTDLNIDLRKPKSEKKSRIGGNILPKSSIVTLPSGTELYKAWGYKGKRFDKLKGLKNRPMWLGLSPENLLTYSKSNNGFLLWVAVPTKTDIITYRNKDLSGDIYDEKKSLCPPDRIDRIGNIGVRYCKHFTPIFFQPDFGVGEIIKITFEKPLKLLNLLDPDFAYFVEENQEFDHKGRLWQSGDYDLIGLICDAVRNCDYSGKQLDITTKERGDSTLYHPKYNPPPQNIKGLSKMKGYKIDKTKKGENRRSEYNRDKKLVQELMKWFPEIDGYIFQGEGTFHDELCVFHPNKLGYKLDTVNYANINENPVPEWILQNKVPKYNQFMDRDSGEKRKLFTIEEVAQIQKEMKIESKKAYKSFVISQTRIRKINVGGMGKFEIKPEVPSLHPNVFSTYFRKDGDTSVRTGVVKPNNGFILWIPMPTKKQIKKIINTNFRLQSFGGLCSVNTKPINLEVWEEYEGVGGLRVCDHYTPLFYESTNNTRPWELDNRLPRIPTYAQFMNRDFISNRELFTLKQVREIKKSIDTKGNIDHTFIFVSDSEWRDAIDK